MEQKQALIDLAHLDSQTMGDRDLRREILKIFIEQMELRLVDLNVEARDLPELAHSIKGSAKGIGAWAVVEAAERVEHGGSMLAENVEILRESVRAAGLEAQRLLMD